MNKRWILVALLALLGLVSAACSSDDSDGASSTTAGGSSSAAGLTGEPILIGVVQDLSGPIGPFGEQMLRGGELAVEQFNAAGGLDGRPVELVIEDLASDRSVIATATSKLAGRGVVAIHGPTSSTALVVGAPVAASEGLVMVPPGSQEAFDDSVLNDWVFRVAAVTADALPDVLEQMQEASPFTKLAIFYDPANNASVDDAKLLQEYASTSGYEVVAVETAEEGASDFSSQISNISSSGADAIWMSHVVEENAGFMIQARERGIDAQFLGGATFTNPEIFEIAGEAGEGAITYVPFLATSSNPDTAAFAAAFEEFEGSAPGPFNALGFDAMWGILHGLEQAESVDREALRDAMGALSYDGAIGTITWDGPGDNTTPSVVVVRVEDGKFVEIAQ